MGLTLMANGSILCVRGYERLGVHSDFRRHHQIGKGLIWKAVTTANGWGCDRFLATVQIQNVRFFRRLFATPTFAAGGASAASFFRTPP